MICFMAGYPMLVKNNPVEDVLGGFKQVDAKTTSWPGQKLSTFAVDEGAGMASETWSVSGDGIVICEGEYLDAGYLKNRKPRPFDGRAQGPRSDAVFRDPQEILEAISLG